MRMLNEFHENELKCHASLILRHDQTKCTQCLFVTYVLSLVDAFDSFGNPFKDIGNEFVLLDSKIIADANVTHAIRNAYSQRKINFDRYVIERIQYNEKSVFAVIEKIKLKNIKVSNKVTKMTSL